MRQKISAVLIVILLSLSTGAHGFWGWMTDGASAQFTEADWDILKDTARETLDAAADGKQVNWRNSETGNRGAMKALMTFMYEESTCRRMAFLNVSSDGTRGVLNYNLCRQADGTWGFVSDSEISGQS